MTEATSHMPESAATATAAASATDAPTYYERVSQTMPVEPFAVLVDPGVDDDLARELWAAVEELADDPRFCEYRFYWVNHGQMERRDVNRQGVIAVTPGGQFFARAQARCRLWVCAQGDESYGDPDAAHELAIVEPGAAAAVLQRACVPPRPVKVSVIVPVYNRAVDLAQSLPLLVEQTMADDLEVILVDDGSTDGSAEVLDQWQERYPELLRVYHRANGGAARARNFGLGRARGEYVGFVDADDLVDRTMFQKLYQSAVDQDADVATCGFYRTRKGWSTPFEYLVRRCYGASACQEPGLLVHNSPYVWNKLFRRSFLIEHGLHFNEALRIYEDFLFTYSALVLANRVTKVGECLYSYMFMTGGSLTETFSDKRFDFFPACRALVSVVRQAGLFYQLENSLLFQIMAHGYRVLDYLPQDEDQRTQIKCFNKEFFELLDEFFPWWRDYGYYFKNAHRGRRRFTSRRWLARRMKQTPQERAAEYRERMAEGEAPGAAYARVMAAEPLDPRRVYIDSQHGENLSGNMFYVLKELLTDPSYADCTVGLGYAPHDDVDRRAQFRALLAFYGLDADRVTFLPTETPAQAEFLARSTFLFSDTSLPVWWVKRPGQDYTLTWHGMPLKTCGRHMAQEYERQSNLMRNFSQADHVIFQNREMVQIYQRAYDYGIMGQGQTLLLGYPRNQALVEPQGAWRKAPAPEPGVQRILYMPTWRGTVAQKQSSDHLGTLLAQIDAQLTDAQEFVVKLHPYDAAALDFGDFAHVKPYPAQYEAYDYLATCDALVTDYSSVMFDFACTRRPMVLFTYDKADYLRDRGMYFDLDELGLPQAATVDELVALLSAPADQESLDAFAERFAPVEHGTCAARVCANALQGERPDCPHIPCGTDPVSVVFAHDLRAAHAKELVGWLADGTAGEPVAFTYDMRTIRNKELLLQLPESVALAGSYGAFESVADADQAVLSAFRDDVASVDEHWDDVERLARTEWGRVFGSKPVRQVVVYGFEQWDKLVLAAFAPCQRRVLVLRGLEADLCDQVPKRLLRQFGVVVDLDGGNRLDWHPGRVERTVGCASDLLNL
ncbi:MAG: CDP-glycerol glycerophosphotransferase family protein [Coriobacteriia bacterium]|nr:CDP-glycerol glycerophosphotransferase family protein [Coriobacteriia bacterium]